MRLLYINKTKGVTLTPSSENPNYPIGNLQDSRLSRHFRFTGDTAENIVISNGGVSKISASYVAVLGHNLTAAAVVKIEGNDLDAWGAPAFTATITWSADIMLKDFTEAEYFYWRFTFVDAANPNTYIKVGLLYLGTYYQVLQGFEKNFNNQLVNTDISHFSDSGQSYSRKGINFRVYKFSFTWWEDAVKRQVETIVKSVGKSDPFIALLDELNFVAMPALYCKIEAEPEYNNIIAYIWQSGITLREVF